MHRTPQRVAQFVPLKCFPSYLTPRSGIPRAGRRFATETSPACNSREDLFKTGSCNRKCSCAHTRLDKDGWQRLQTKKRFDGFVLVLFHLPHEIFRVLPLVDPCSQDEIAFREAVDLVPPSRDLNFSPGEEDVWMVTVFLRKFTHAVYELEGFAKVGKVFVMWCSSITLQPSTCLCKATSSSPLSGGTPPRQSTHVLAARLDILRMILALRSQAYLPD